MGRLILILATLVGVLARSPASAQSPSQRFLPSADDFHLTLQENPQTAIRWGPPCGGVAGEVVRCHMFTISLENESPDTVRFGGDCKERVFTISIKDPTAAGGWLRVSNGGLAPCHRSTGLRLQPGEKTLIESGLISLSHAPYTLHAPYTVRASLTLRGCIEPPDHTDCLSPLQAIPSTTGSASGIHLEEPVTLVSNEIIAESPNAPDLGEMRFAFVVEMRAFASGDTRPRGCTRENTSSLDCAIFRYTIHNLGDRGVRIVVANCNGGSLTPDIVPEYGLPGSEWKSLSIRNGACISSLSDTTAIPQGGTAEGEFTLSTLDSGYSPTPLEAPGKYQLRFKFSPHACFASPDGRSSATLLQHPPPVVAPELAVDVP
jgi:hypothetical protein